MTFRTWPNRCLLARPSSLRTLHVAGGAAPTRKAAPARSRALPLLLLAAVALAPQLRAVNCTTQSQMTEAKRTALADAVRNIAQNVQTNKVDLVKAATIPSVAAQFDSIAGSIGAVSPLIQGASLTINAMYELDASDLKAPQEETQFFCGISMSAMRVDINIPQLPPGLYALAIVHATGVKDPQAISMILQKEGEQWHMAGFFVRPLAAAGHDGVWYWTKARDYAKNKQNWNAYFYYQTAANLLLPVDFLSSPNLEKLNGEQTKVMPQELPGANPMNLAVNGQNVSVTNIHTDGSLGGLDLVVSYNTASVADPVAARSRNIDVMKALLTAHPELREAFHGLWVFANAEGQRPYSIELPMNQIQ